jgi:hypothetical protein
MPRYPLIRINLIIIPALHNQSHALQMTFDLECFVSEKMDFGVPVLLDMT